jgi:protein phosphatase
MLKQDVTAVAGGTEPFTRPDVAAGDLIRLADHVKGIFAAEPVVLQLASPIVVVGDLQGHIHDLIRILKGFQPPNRSANVRYLFLGNLVGRGEFSLETVTLVYLMKAVYPDRVFIIRGNHEFEILCTTSGFLTEITSEFPSAAREVFEHFLATFSFTPMVAVIDVVNVCLHSGIGPALPSLADIRRLARPILNPAAPGVKSLIWSNPSTTLPDFADSARSGPSFGEKALLQFLERSECVRLIRTHEPLETGFESLFEDRLLTIFSASNYLGRSRNEAAVVCVTPEGEDGVHTFPPLKYLQRKSQGPAGPMSRISLPRPAQFEAPFVPMKINSSSSTLRIDRRGAHRAQIGAMRVQLSEGDLAKVLPPSPPFGKG